MANPERPHFQELQYQFTQHLRQPDKAKRPDGIEDRRMAIYRDLLFNNIKGFIDNGFPVLHSLYREKTWLALVRKFFAEHQSRSPYFIEISKEFLRYLQESYTLTSEDPPFMLELAHYEWVELALMVDKVENDWTAINPHGDLLQDAPVLSKLLMSLVYQWPVHRIGKAYRPAQAPNNPTYLLVHRDKKDDVRFIEINPVTARLVTLLQDEPGRTGLSLMQQIAKELKHPKPEIVVQGGHQTLLKLHHSGVILGTA